ncbi:hypothetical protein CW731_03350 [Polaribacter sp. ALD11]|uniref:hypothetical protein n=1 Tax=Polaribacter sp. ALD11 TaxID=2058137 RepID=UPI000C3019E6|nr:hypothetical protein [Polaribacter sp. ALD11]AUC84392.1 hypothetical protein CW731_03350 [Polaribacter sp. ALD11]
MKTNKLDNSIKEKLANRSIEPSVSAWERLSAQLDEQPKQKKKGWFFYIGYAASILALVSIGIYTFSNEKKIESPKQIIVEGVIDTITILNKIDKHFNEIPVEKAIVLTEKVEEQQENKKKINKNFIINKSKNTRSSAVKNLKNELIIKTQNKTIISKVEENDKNNIPKVEDIAKTKRTEKTRIKVSADDLLFAVTNTSKEIKEKDIKNTMSREVLLQTIKIELKKSNLKVNPETILAEVERTINDDAFQNNFLKSLKKKISNIATAIASRND